MREGDGMDNSRIAELLVFLYGEETGSRALPLLMKILEDFQRPPEAKAAISHRDAFLISYGDMLGSAHTEPGLARLERFLAKWNRGAFSYLHLLPFHPYSSDDGFSVIDYREVDPRFGSWDDIEKLGRSFKLVFDFVINHGSVKSEWFKKFLAGDGDYGRWYLTRPGAYDYAAVVRPRTHPLFTPFQRDDGSTAHVWTTFSADQADYDFSQVPVLLEFIRVFLSYARRGGRMLRLDAIAYLWKEDGTPCIHHPKTHGVVKLFRALIDYLGLDMMLLTETNVPHRENLSYFGERGPAAPSGDEAHLVYNFALPPLTLYAALSGDAGPLKTWAAALPVLPPGQCFLNFLASHDGVGLTPARGLVDEAAFGRALEEAQRRGALVSMKSSPQGPVPYELNCSWADVTAPESLGSPEIQARAFLNTYGPVLALPGLPAVYFHSWIGSRSWKEGPETLGYNRAINREKPSPEQVEKELEAPGSFRYLVHRGFSRLLEFRQSHEAFSPQVPCRILDSPNSVFALLRGPDPQGRGVICIHNFGPVNASIDLSQINKLNPTVCNISSLCEIPIEGNSFIWIAIDENKQIKKLEI
jgi:sucrose phosphorylase